MPLVCNQTKALLLAFISTGKVMKLKIVVMAKRKMPKSKSAGNVFINRIPPSKIHCMYLELKLTAGTSDCLLYTSDAADE